MVFLSAGSLMYSAKCGLGITYDSQNYLAAAESLAKGGALETQFGEPYMAQPPLFPVLLYVLKLDQQGRFFFNLVCLACSLMLFWQIIGMVITSFPLRLVAFGCMGLSTQLLLLHNFVWSEPLFLTLLYLMIFLSFRFYDSPRWYLLLIISLAGVLLCLQRNAGLFVVAGLALAWVLSHFSWKRLAEAAVIFLPGVVAFGWWNFGKFFGEGAALADVQFFGAVPHNLYQYVFTMGTWLLPRTVFEGVLVLVGLALLSVLIWPFQARIANSDKLRLLALVFLVYLVGLSLSHKTISDDIERYLAVVFPVCLMVLFAWFERRWTSALARRLILAVLVSLSIYTVARSAKNTQFWHSTRCGYHASR